MSRSRWARAVSAIAFGGLIVGCPEAKTITGPSSIRSIMVTPDTATIAVGAAHTLVATALDGSGNPIAGVSFFWSTQTSSIATVSSGGVVTGQSVGPAQIAASAQGISGYAMVTVTAKPIGSVTVVPTSATLRIATTLQLSDTIKDISGAVVHATAVWTSSFPDTVGVDQNGLVTALKLGTATITASYGGKSGSAAITVSVVPVKSVVITSAAPSIYIGQTTQLTAVAKDSAGNILTGRVIRWQSQNTPVATVDSVAGLVTGVSGGVAPIVATSEGATSNPVAVTVSAAPASTVVLSPNVSQVHVGQVTTLMGTVTDATGHIVPNPTITFQSSNNNIANVQFSNADSAHIMAVAPGTATITGTDGAATGTATIIVSLVGVDSVHVSAAQDTLILGQTETLTAVAYDSSGNVLSGRPITWSSSNNGVATVSPAGLVTTHGAGTVVIFATISGVQGSLAMVVSVVPVATVIVVPAADTILPLGQVQLSDTLKDSGGHVLTGRLVTWSSRNNGIATVNSTGLVTGEASPGSVWIVATSEGVSDSSLTLVLAPVQTVIVEPPTTTITNAQTAQLSDTLKDASGNTLTGRVVTWSSSNNSIATVSSTGLVTPALPNSSTDSGTITITATVNQPTGSRSGTATVTVKLVPVALVVVYPTPDTIYATSPLNTVQLHDSTKDAMGNNLTNRPVTWSVTSGTVAGVNASGLVTANNTAAGATTITATSTDGPAGSGSVAVLGHSQTVNVTTSTDTLSLSGTPPHINSENVTLQVLDSFGTDVTASRVATLVSSDPSTVKVTLLAYPTFNIAAQGSGTSPSVTITAMTTDPKAGVVSSTPITITLVP